MQPIRIIAYPQFFAAHDTRDSRPIRVVRANSIGVTNGQAAFATPSTATMA
jgi:hypothetical protein